MSKTVLDFKELEERIGMERRGESMNEEVKYDSLHPVRVTYVKTAPGAESELRKTGEDSQ